MSEDLNNYLQDLVYLIKEDYNDALKNRSETKNEIQKAFNEGKELAYFGVLNLIESQLLSFFGEETELVGNIAPNPGEKAVF